MGCSRKNSAPPPPTSPLPRMGFWKFSQEGGSKILEIQAGGGVKLKKKSSGGVSLTIIYTIRTFSSVTPQHSHTRRIVEIFCFSYFSPNMNDNLSSFAGPFIAENTNNKILKNVPSHVVATKRLECLTHFYSYPDPAHHRCEPR